MSLRYLLRAGRAAAIGIGALICFGGLGILTVQMACAATPAESADAQAAAAASGPSTMPKQLPGPPGTTTPVHPDNMPVKRPQPSQSNDPISRPPPASGANAK
jgi:hypothetical protein